MQGSRTSRGWGRAEPGAQDWDMEELRRCLEGVLDGVPEDLWLRIQDEGILELCIGGDPCWWSVIRHGKQLWVQL
jgi:hypothetical protein